MTAPAHRVVIYVRISSDPTGQAAGIERQEADCRALAEQLGWEVVDVRRDNDVSAYSNKARPGFNALLDDLRTGHADAVIAWHPDRLYRRLPDLEELAHVANERGTAIRTVKAGTVDLSTPTGVMTAEILASVAKHEVAHAAERMRRAKAEKVAKGEYRGGPRPFGFEPDGVTVRPDEARWIVAATEAVINGESLNGICRTLAANGVHTAERRRKQADGTKGDPQSREWVASQLRGMLLRPRNAGLLEANGEIVGKAVWDPIVDEERWRACMDVLSNPGRRTITTNARVWLLSGIARCHCGSVVKCSTAGLGGSRPKKNPDDPNGEPITITRPGHIAAYRCRATNGHVTRRAEQHDAYIEAVVVRRLSRPDARAVFTPPRRDEEPTHDLVTQVEALRAKLESLAADYAADAITRAQMLEATAVTRARIDQFEAKMAARVEDSVLAGAPLGSDAFGEQWESYTLDRKRAIIAATMEITFKPAKRGPKPGGNKGGIDTDSVEIKWKTPGAV